MALTLPAAEVAPLLWQGRSIWERMSKEGTVDEKLKAMLDELAAASVDKEGHFGGRYSINHPHHRHGACLEVLGSLCERCSDWKRVSERYERATKALDAFARNQSKEVAA